MSPHNALARGAAIVSVLTAAPAGMLLAGQQPPQITTIPVLPGGSFTAARGLSSDGSTAVGIGDIPGAARAWKWTAQTGTQSLGTPANQPDSAAFAVNANGTAVVGTASPTMAFVWSAPGTIAAVVYPPAWTQQPPALVDLRAVDATGQTAAGRVVAGSATRAARWNAGELSLLPAAPEQRSSAAYAMSADALTIAGSIEFELDAPRACRWGFIGPPQVMNPIPGVPASTALACSADGSIIVGTGEAAQGDRAFVWPVGEEPRLLPLAPGWASSNAAAISADGFTIGGSVRTGAQQRQAVIWRASSGAHQLSQYLTSLGTQIGPRQLDDCVGISADGSTLLVRGYVTGSIIERCFIITGVPAGNCPADMGMTGGVLGSDGVLNNNDFVVFVSEFFAGTTLADIAGPGASPGPDAQHDNNDFILFVDRFFAGCS